MRLSHARTPPAQEQFSSPYAIPHTTGTPRTINCTLQDPNNTQIWSVDTTDARYLDVFDTLHLFSAAKWRARGIDDVNAQQRGLIQEDAKWHGIVNSYNQQHNTARTWTAGVFPGWDERKAPGHPEKNYIERKNGTLYEASWCAAIASEPEWITITSYNEWLEGSQLEPSVTYGNKYLDLTKYWAAKYKAGDPGCSL